MSKNSHGSKSDCPLAYALDIIGDKWSLIIIRELMFCNKHEFKDFLDVAEKISTNILTDRLKKLTSLEILGCIGHPEIKTRKIYYLTESGIDMLPTIIEMTLWASRNMGEMTDECKELMQPLLDDKYKTMENIRTEIRLWNEENIK